MGPLGILLLLTASAAYSWRQVQPLLRLAVGYVLPVLRLRLLRLVAELRLWLYLQWILPLAMSTDAAIIDGYGCFYVLSLRLLPSDTATATAIATSGGYDCGSCCVTAVAASATVSADATVASGSCCG